MTAAFSGLRGIRSVAALSEFAPTMSVGGPRDCPASPTCLVGFEVIYGLTFAGFTPVDDPESLGVLLEQGDVDLAVLPVTHPVIERRELVVLGDDLGMHALESPVILGDTSLEEALAPAAPVLAALDTAALRHLNHRVEQLGREAAVGEYLQSLDLQG